MRILIVEDHQILRQGLAALLRQSNGGFEVLEASEGRAAIALAASEAPDVIVMDVSLPEMNGIEATRRIIAANPNAKVIALSAHSDRKLIVEMLSAGAKGYVPKEAAFEELGEAIRTVMDNRIYLSGQVADTLSEDLLPGSEQSDALLALRDRLTPREREVLQLIAEGKATKEVAAILKVSVKTAETHRRSIMQKLDVTGVAEMTKYALREGLTALDF
jgi:DNA-binding NarL/FixJ family response regulator